MPNYVIYPVGNEDGIDYVSVLDENGIVVASYISSAEADREYLFN